jgi:hypothetical protein
MSDEENVTRIYDFRKERFRRRCDVSALVCPELPDPVPGTVFSSTPSDVMIAFDLLPGQVLDLESRAFDETSFTQYMSDPSGDFAYRVMSHHRITDRFMSPNFEFNLVIDAFTVTDGETSYRMLIVFGNNMSESQCSGVINLINPDGFCFYDFAETVIMVSEQNGTIGMDGNLCQWTVTHQKEAT